MSREIKSPPVERVPLSGEAEEAYYRYRRGILEGNLEPLADYLAAGHPMDRVLRTVLVELIDGRAGGGLYRIEVKKNRRGAGTALSLRKTRIEQGQMVAYFRLLDPSLKWDARVDDTAKHFGVKRTKIAKALQAIEAASEPSQSG